MMIKTFNQRREQRSPWGADRTIKYHLIVGWHFHVSELEFLSTNAIHEAVCGDKAEMI